MADQQAIQALNELLKGEYMAIDIYEKTKGLQGDEQVTNMLTLFQQDHQKHADLLSRRINELEGEAETGTGFAGIMADASSIINSFLGPGNLLEQAYSGEDKEIHLMRTG